jgi:hypothetical protein
LPWARTTPQATYPSDISASSANITSPDIPALSLGRSAVASGTSTPSSAGFVSLEGLFRHNSGVPNENTGHTSSRDTENGSVDLPEFLRHDPTGLDKNRYAVLYNDWPYNAPYGVRHYCVWSRVSNSAKLRCGLADIRSRLHIPTWSTTTRTHGRVSNPKV